MRHIIPISGKDSLATAMVQRTRDPNLSYEFIYNDTHMELPETYEWMDSVERTLGIKIARCGKSLEEVIHEQGMIPSQQRRFCTKYSKIFPMRDFIGKDDATIYIGLRHDEDRVGAQEAKNIKVCYPLKECRIDLRGVYQIVEKVGLMPPNFFWPRVHDEVRRRLGEGEFILKEAPRYVFDRAFAWRSRPNCFMCFYQRRYEWAGLLEFHPDLFNRAEGLENMDWAGCEDRREKNFFWIPDYPLSKIRENAEALVQKRIDALVDMLSTRLQSELFTDSMIDNMELAQKSCGLYCGK